MTPSKKEYGWGDLLIAAAPALAGGLTGYGAAGAQAGLDTMKVQQADIAQKQKDEMDLLKVKAGLMGKIKPAVKKPDEYMIAQGPKGTMAVSKSDPTKQVAIDVGGKASSGKPISMRIQSNPKNTTLPEGMRVGGNYLLNNDEFNNLRSQGVLMAQNYAPGAVFNQQTGTWEMLEKVPGTRGVVQGLPPQGQPGVPTVPRKSVFTPQNYPMGKDLTKQQADEISKSHSVYISKTEPDRDALSKMKGISDSINLYMKDNNVLAGKQAMQQYLTALEKGPIGPSDREAVAQAYGGWEKLKRYVEEKIEGDPVTAMNELSKVSGLLEETINRRINMEKSVNVDYLKSINVDEGYSKNLFDLKDYNLGSEKVINGVTFIKKEDNKWYRK
jgi:hypothetical protein